MHFRKERVGSLIRELLSEAIAHRLHDPRIEVFTTITRVEMTGDLQIARVFVSTPGGDSVERRTIAGIRHAGGFLQRLVAGQLSLRHCPELRFEIDETAKTMRHTLDLLDKNQALESARLGDGELDDAESESPGDDGDDDEPETNLDRHGGGV